MSEAIDFGDDRTLGEQSVPLRLYELVERMRAVGSGNDELSLQPGAENGTVMNGGLVIDGVPTSARRVKGRQRITKIGLPGGGLIIDRSREIYVVVGPDDERLSNLEDESGESPEGHEKVTAEPPTDVRESHFSEQEDDRPLELGKTLRILGARALQAAKGGLVGMAEEYSNKAGHRYESRRREEALRSRRNKEPRGVRIIRGQLDAYFKFIASGGLNTQGELPAQVVYRLRQMDEMGFPYFDDLDEQPES